MNANILEPSKLIYFSFVFVKENLQSTNNLTSWEYRQDAKI